jgi:hypothetical protein
VILEQSFKICEPNSFNCKIGKNNPILPVSLTDWEKVEITVKNMINYKVLWKCRVVLVIFNKIKLAKTVCIVQNEEFLLG